MRTVGTTTYRGAPRAHLRWTAAAATIALLGWAALAQPSTAEAANRQTATRPATHAPGAWAARAQAAAKANDKAGRRAAAPRAVAPQAAAPQAAATPDGFVPLTPGRIVDTRAGTGGVPKVRIGAGGTLVVQVPGKGGVPATGAVAVVVNLTAVTPTSNTYLSAYPTGSPRPDTSNVSVPKGVTTATSAVVALGTNGAITIFNAAGSLDLAIDVAGYFVDGGEYRPLTPTRLLDTRSGVGAPQGPVAGGASVTVTVAGRAGVPTSGVAAVIGTVTVVAPSAATYAVAYPAGATRPGASTVNAPAKRTVANSTIVKLGSGGGVTLFSSAGSTHLLFDVAGYLTTGGSYVAIAPVRAADTRRDEDGNTPLQPEQTDAFLVAGVGDGDSPTLAVPALGVSAVVINLTAVKPTTNTFLGTAPAMTAVRTSTVNTTAGVTAANLAIVRVGSGGMINVYNSRGATHAIIDIVGYFTTGRAPDVPVGGTLPVSGNRDGGGARPAESVTGVSTDGRYVMFDSTQTDVVPFAEYDGGIRTTYVRDTVLGWTSGISLGLPVVGRGMSSDAASIALEADLLGEGTNAVVLSQFSGNVDLASLDLAGDPSTASESALSANGRWLVYLQNGAVLRRDLTTTTVVTVRTCADCTDLSVSDDGRFLTYVSAGQVAHWDTVTSTGGRVSSSSTDEQADAPAYAPSASANGRYVVFTSAATNLAGAPTSGAGYVYVKDTFEGDLTRVSVTPAGQVPNAAATDGVISADGTTVAFVSSATDLTPTSVPSGRTQIYVRNLAAGTTALASRVLSGPGGDGDSTAPVLSSTGAWVAYRTTAASLGYASGGGPGVVLTRLR